MNVCVCLRWGRAGSMGTQLVRCRPEGRKPRLQGRHDGKRLHPRVQKDDLVFAPQCEEHCKGESHLRRICQDEAEQALERVWGPLGRTLLSPLLFDQCDVRDWGLSKTFEAMAKMRTRETRQHRRIWNERIYQRVSQQAKRSTTSCLLVFDSNSNTKQLLAKCFWNVLLVWQHTHTHTFQWTPSLNWTCGSVCMKTCWTCHVCNQELTKLQEI